HEMAAHQLTWNGEVAEMQELWRNPPYPQTSSIPIYHEGHLYSSHGRILTCLDARSGERIWRSRPPGGRALILTGGHLLTVARNGDLVAVAATPEGYRETARLPVFDEESYTPVSVARGYVYLRNLKQMARVKITDQATLAVAETPAPRGVIAELVARLQKAPEPAARTAILDDFMQQPRFPIVEEVATQGNSLVHFVYRGDIDDIALVLGMDRDVAMTRVEGTDFYYHTAELDSAGHWEYHFSHYDEPLVDPLNPLLIGTEPRVRNELRMPEWSVPDFLHEPTGARGRLESFSFTSESRGDDRTIEVYLPAGYDAGESRYPLLLVTEGDRALEVAKMDVSLDNL
ncbi:MAG: hypothetical protein GY713_17305, partial [Actinomycetia bacterium]|nr:hypothetical protein [Actinomycetes bacterium]